MVQILSELDLTILNIFNFLLQHFPRIIMIFIAPFNFLLEFLYIDFYVALDLLGTGLEHVLQLC